ncbi:MAG: WYL domain-containing protein [Actinobacteria bacterium]|nr:MAG: WYL domain-containing protein [Actinomycetota bacterium]
MSGTLPFELDLNVEFREALQIMEETSENLLVTGRAGTGKSTLLDYFRSITKKKIVVLAPTGVAAVNVAGQTIHSFFRFQPNATPDKIRRINDSIYQQLDAIVIDEVSMVRADLLDLIDAFMRKNGRTKGAPFGGIQMIFIGDLYQLPPVVTRDERDYLESRYESEYFFDSDVFSEVEFELVELEKVYRQTDANFIGLLNGIRNRSIDERELELINARLLADDKPPHGGVGHGELLHGELPGSELPHGEPRLGAPPNGAEFPKGAIHLTTTNAMARERNEAELATLAGKTHSFEARLEGDFDEKSLPTDPVLNLKKGAQVMLLNNDSQGRWVNGTIGVLEGIKKAALVVRLAGGLEEVEPVTWNRYRFVWNKETKSVASEVIGAFTQFPVKLAWAVTIHKSQGKTFDSIVVDIGRGTFAPGQLYVALSRCRTLEGVFLKKPIRKSHIWLDWRVVKFMTGYQYERSDRLLSLEEKIGLLEEAIADGLAIEMTYLKPDDTKSRRTVRPMRVEDMEFKGKSFLGMRAFCMKRQAERTFRIDRILEMAIAE